MNVVIDEPVIKEKITSHNPESLILPAWRIITKPMLENEGEQDTFHRSHSK